MPPKFRLKKSLLVFLTFIFVFGILIQVLRSDFILQFISYDSPEARDKGPKQELEEDVVKGLNNELYLVLYAEDQHSSQRLKENIVTTLSYMKKKTEVRDAENIPEDLGDYQGVIIATEFLDKIPSMSMIDEYVFGGGDVFFAIRPEISDSLYAVYRKLGIYELGTYLNTTGIEVFSSFFNKKEKSAVRNSQIYNSSIIVSLENDAVVHAKSLNGLPLLWEMKYGDGEFVMFNGTMLADKVNRGLITGAIQQFGDYGLHPIINVKVSFIDSFPMPIPSGVNQKIYSEFKTDISGFYRGIWWSDIQKAAKQHDLHYTGAAIVTFNDNVMPPFNYSSSQYDNLVQYGREILKMDGELAFNGFNQVPLAMSGWDKANMKSALETSLSLIQDAVPTYQVNTYIPPQYKLGQKGLEVLQQVFPSISIISSHYLSDENPEVGLQEFQPNQTFISLPIVTSGYENLEEMNWAMVNAASSLGVYSHSISPGDVLAAYNSDGSNWDSMYTSYQNYLENVNKSYPWLRSMIATEAANEVKDFIETEVFIEEEVNQLKVYITPFYNEFSFVLRTDKEIVSHTNCEITKLNEETYFIKANDMIFQIGLEE